MSTCDVHPLARLAYGLAREWVRTMPAPVDVKLLAAECSAVIWAASILEQKLGREIDEATENMMVDAFILGTESTGADVVEYHDILSEDAREFLVV